MGREWQTAAVNKAWALLRLKGPGRPGKGEQIRMMWNREGLLTEVTLEHKLPSHQQVDNLRF